MAKKSEAKRIKDTLIGIPIFFLLYVLSVMFFTYRGLYKDLDVMMLQQFGIQHYTIKSASLDYWIFEPSAAWWIQLDQGFDIQKIKQNKLFWDNSNMPDDERINSEAITETVKSAYKIEVHDFQAYFAEDQQMGDMVMCSDGVPCNVYVYAKDGDKNLFISIYSM